MCSLSLHCAPRRESRSARSSPGRRPRPSRCVAARRSSQCCTTATPKWQTCMRSSISLCERRAAAIDCACLRMCMANDANSL
eukprot:4014027-Pleurochrysis_carterae.AAC.1